MPYMKFIRRRIKKIWTLTPVLNFVTGGKNGVKQRNVNRGIWEQAAVLSSVVHPCILIKKYWFWPVLVNGFHIFYQRMKVSPEARRLAKYKEKKKEISVVTLQFDVTFCTSILCAPSHAITVTNESGQRSKKLLTCTYFIVAIVIVFSWVSAAYVVANEKLIFHVPRICGDVS